VTDDTAAINAAISSQPRCGQGCDSSTTQPALVYFPPGTYLVSSPIIAMYYTQLVGSPTNLPVLKAAPTFQGIAVIDSDPYIAGGANWYQNQNNCMLFLIKITMFELRKRISFQGRAKFCYRFDRHGTRKWNWYTLAGKLHSDCRWICS